jgi:hypothetical protein
MRKKEKVLTVKDVLERRLKDSERYSIAKPATIRMMQETVGVLAQAMRDATIDDTPEDFKIVKAPWSKKQVKALEVWQDGHLPFMSSYQSGRDLLLSADFKKMAGKLIPTRAGWKSPYSGKIIQKWARKFMFRLAEDDGLGFRVTGSLLSHGNVGETGFLPSPRPSASEKRAELAQRK